MGAPIGNSLVPQSEPKKHTVFYWALWAFLVLISAAAVNRLNNEPHFNGFVHALPWSTLAWSIVFGLVWLANVASIGRQKVEAQAAAERRQKMREFFMTPLQPIAAPSIVLHKDEVCYQVSAAKLYTMHKHRSYQGGYGGASFRVARGVYLRSGGFRGSPVVTQAMEPDEEGIVYLTNQRFLFVGESKSVEVPFTKIASTEPYSDGLKIDIVNKTPIILTTGDFWLYATFQRLHEGLLAGATESQLPEDLK